MVRISTTETSSNTRRLAAMNLALRGIEDDFCPECADTFRRDRRPGLRANPPINDSYEFRKCGAPLAEKKACCIAGATSTELQTTTCVLLCIPKW